MAGWPRGETACAGKSFHIPGTTHRLGKWRSTTHFPWAPPWGSAETGLCPRWKLCPTGIMQRASARDRVARGGCPQGTSRTSLGQELKRCLIYRSSALFRPPSFPLLGVTTHFILSNRCTPLTHAEQNRKETGRDGLFSASSPTPDKKLLYQTSPSSCPCHSEPQPLTQACQHSHRTLNSLSLQGPPSAAGHPGTCSMRPLAWRLQAQFPELHCLSLGASQPSGSSHLRCELPAARHGLHTPLLSPPLDLKELQQQRPLQSSCVGAHVSPLRRATEIAASTTISIKT